MFGRSPNSLRWRGLAEQEMRRLEESRAQGVARLLNTLNHAQRIGDAGAVEAVRQELERFLEAASTVAALQPQIRTTLQPLRPEPVSAERLPTAPAEEPQPKPGQPIRPKVPALPRRGDIYWISSATLAQAHAFLTRRAATRWGQEPEWILAVTGLRVGRLRTLEHLIEVRQASQSSGQASLDMADFTRVAIELYEHGQALHAIFHSHRFAGPPSPSGTDNHLQETLEQGGYPAIQAVFSEDGYVRFFTRRRPFAVQVYGKGVIPVDGHSNLYRIVHFGTLPHPARATRAAGRGDGVRSLSAPARR